MWQSLQLHRDVLPPTAKTGIRLYYSLSMCGGAYKSPCVIPSAGGSLITSIGAIWNKMVLTCFRYTERGVSQDHKTEISMQRFSFGESLQKPVSPTPYHHHHHYHQKQYIQSLISYCLIAVGSNVEESCSHYLDIKCTFCASNRLKEHNELK